MLYGTAIPFSGTFSCSGVSNISFSAISSPPAPSIPAVLAPPMNFGEAFFLTVSVPSEERGSLAMGRERFAGKLLV